MRGVTRWLAVAVVVAAGCAAGPPRDGRPHAHPDPAGPAWSLKISGAT